MKKKKPAPKKTTKAGEPTRSEILKRVKASLSTATGMNVSDVKTGEEAKKALAGAKHVRLTGFGCGATAKNQHFFDGECTLDFTVLNTNENIRVIFDFKQLLFALSTLTDTQGLTTEKKTA